MTELGYGAFGGCDSITNIAINCKEVKDMFSINNMTAVKEVVLGNNVEYIGNYAFAGFSGLTNITIPENVTTIGNGAFSYCI